MQPFATHKDSRLLAGAALALFAFAGTALAEEKIAQGEMPHYCLLEAASAFKVGREEVITLPAEHHKGQFVVYGQTPAQGDQALFFSCTFNAQGQFVGVHKDSDKRSQGHASQGHAAQGHGGVAVGDMARHCAGEASAKFHQRPQNISTQPAIKDQGMYSVFGQFPPSGADPTIFICTYSAEGKLVGVDKQ